MAVWVRQWYRQAIRPSAVPWVVFSLVAGTEEAATTAIDQACRMRRLPTVRGQFPDLADAASREQRSYRSFLAELLLAECDADCAGDRGRDGGHRVKYVPATKLVNELVEAADENVLVATITRHGRVIPLCIDKLGYMELGRRGAELLFQVLTERAGKDSGAIASNKSFGGWTKSFTDPRLCAAIVEVASREVV